MHSALKRAEKKSKAILTLVFQAKSCKLYASQKHLEENERGAVGGALAPEPGTEMQSNGTTRTTAQRHELGCLSATLSVDATSQFMSINSSATNAQRSTCALRLG